MIDFVTSDENRMDECLDPPKLGTGDPLSNGLTSVEEGCTEGAQALFEHELKVME